MGAFISFFVTRLTLAALDILAGASRSVNPSLRTPPFPLTLAVATLRPYVRVTNLWHAWQGQKTKQRGVYVCVCWIIRAADRSLPRYGLMTLVAMLQVTTHEYILMIHYTHTRMCALQQLHVDTWAAHTQETSNKWEKRRRRRRRSVNWEKCHTHTHTHISLQRGGWTY